jgi:hypothetical protein
MAKALQCPACGNKHPVSALPDAPTFRCEQCGRALKVPAQVRPARVTAARAARERDADRTATMPAPARAPSGQAGGGGVAAPPTPAPAAPQREAARPPPRPGVMWPLRLLAWLVALPVGLLAVVWPARELGFLSGQRLLDVVVGTGWGRYWRVLAIAPAWALVTAVLVQLMVFGLRKLSARRRAIRGKGAAASHASSDSSGGKGRRRGRAGRQRPGRTKAGRGGS